MHEIVVSGTGKDVTPTAEELQDLTAYAKSSGHDLNDLTASHQNIMAMGELVKRLESEHPESFLRWGLSQKGEEGDYWLAIAGQPTDQLLEDLKGLPSDTKLISGAVTTAAELSDVSGALLTSLAKHPDLIKSAGTTATGSATTIVVEYVLTEVGASDRATVDLHLSDALAIAAKNSIDGRLPAEVTFKESQGDPDQLENTVQGGRPLWQGGTPQCTAGFTAQRGGVRGVLTAGHCPNSLVYNNNAGMINPTPITATPAANGIVDIQWHRTLSENGHTTNNQFAATGVGGAGDRVATAAYNPAQGQLICHWGMTTEYSCAQVAQVNQCRNVDGVTMCGLDWTNTRISAGGDSGGPWFYGNVAHGTHASSNVSENTSRYTRIGRVENNLNASVLVN
ncbi:S1 family peptidase [Nocardioides nitrophenolicus]|uniref:S1 family peptidase n=1 Tax=Nocardioides nitrophenolicus TaxID=60489 RepID=UPI00195C96F7|nr:S1 family peptidase [Nocardioides nitrophenolicus]MBM7519247.1 hypothetical protein [Nocardioides nitrophenolicus]